MNNLKTLGIFLFGVLLASFLEVYFRTFVRFLLKSFNGNNIVFIGKDFHLFVSFTFMISFGVFCSLTFVIFKKYNFFNPLKVLICSTLSFLITLFLIIYIHSKLLIIECTACDDGIRRLGYYEITYDSYWIISLSITLLVIGIITFIQSKKKNHLIGLWTREDDGSGLLAIFGWSIEFKTDHTGRYQFWESNQTEDLDFDFIWERIDKYSIKVKEKTTEDWTILTYEITKVKGAYDSKQMKLTEKGKSKFWSSSEPVFRRI